MRPAMQLINDERPPSSKQTNDRQLAIERSGWLRSVFPGQTHRASEVRSALIATGVSRPILAESRWWRGIRCRITAQRIVAA